MRSRGAEWPAVRRRADGAGWEVDCGKVAGGKRVLYRRATEAAARTLASSLKKQRKALGEASLKLTPLQVQDAAAAFGVLSQFTTPPVTLTELATDFIAECEKGVPYHIAVTLSDAIAARIADMRQANRRERSIQSTLSRLSLFSVKNESYPLRDLKEWHIQKKLDEYKEPSTRLGMLRELRAFFAFCKRRCWIVTNPCDGITAPTVERTIPKFMSAESAAHLLHRAFLHSNEMAIIPVLGLFAGLRPSEIKRMEYIDSTGANPCESITVDASMSKVRRLRHVAVSANMVSWIAAVTPAWPKDEFARFEVWRRSEGIEWSPDVMRHTFATYHYAMHQNAALTAAQMGNSTDVLMTHYRGLATKEEAERFWSIMP